MVERIQILRDGASAIYGADAVAGVVNIILRRDFAGTEASVSAGASDRGDAAVQQTSLLWGARTESGIGLLLNVSTTCTPSRCSATSVPGTASTRGVRGCAICAACIRFRATIIYFGDDGGASRGGAGLRAAQPHGATARACSIRRQVHHAAERQPRQVDARPAGRSAGRLHAPASGPACHRPAAAPAGGAVRGAAGARLAAGGGPSRRTRSSGCTRSTTSARCARRHRSTLLSLGAGVRRADRQLDLERRRERAAQSRGRHHRRPGPLGRCLPLVRRRRALYLRRHAAQRVRCVRRWRRARSGAGSTHVAGGGFFAGRFRARPSTCRPARPRCRPARSCAARAWSSGPVSRCRAGTLLNQPREYPQSRHRVASAAYRETGPADPRVASAPTWPGAWRRPAVSPRTARRRSDCTGGRRKACCCGRRRSSGYRAPTLHELYQPRSIGNPETVWVPESAGPCVDTLASTTGQAACLLSVTQRRQSGAAAGNLAHHGLGPGVGAVAFLQPQRRRLPQRAQERDRRRAGGVRARPRRPFRRRRRT